MVQQCTKKSLPMCALRLRRGPSEPTNHEGQKLEDPLGGLLVGVGGGGADDLLGHILGDDEQDGRTRYAEASCQPMGGAPFCSGTASCRLPAWQESALSSVPVARQSRSGAWVSVGIISEGGKAANAAAALQRRRVPALAAREHPHAGSGAARLAVSEVQQLRMHIHENPDQDQKSSY